MAWQAHTKVSKMAVKKTSKCRVYKHRGAVFQFGFGTFYMEMFLVKFVFGLQGSL